MPKTFKHECAFIVQKLFTAGEGMARESRNYTHKTTKDCQHTKTDMYTTQKPKEKLKTRKANQSIISGSYWDLVARSWSGEAPG